MKSKLIFTVFCLICAALSLAAQTSAPDNMVQIPAGKFWIGRTFTYFFDTIGGTPRDRMDDIPANNIYLDAFYIDKYEVTNTDYAKFVEATGGKSAYEKVHTEKWTGTFELVGKGVKGAVTAYRSEPNKSVTVVETSVSPHA